LIIVPHAHVIGARPPREIEVLERERHKLILKFIEARSIVSVGDLLDLLGASEATIRRDINTLAERGEIKRIRGGAEAVRPRLQAHLVGMPFAMSQAINVPQKRAIARAAAQLISPGESIIINGGTTTFALVEYLADHDLDILTNSFPIAAQLLATSRNRITLPGGTIFREQNIVLSPFDNDIIENFWGNRLFTGCYGVNRFGIMEADPLIVQAQRKLLKRSENVVVMADSSKLRRKSSMIVAALKAITTLITDSEASPEELETFKTAGIEIIVAKVEEEDRLQQPA
jgi:DeoR family ulaG and ulaABCDEF operon transcriptional repressor